MSVKANALRRFGRDQRGGAAVEAALCLPVLVLMVMGAAWFGWSQHQLSTMRYALRTTARAVVIDPTLTQSQVSNLVKAEMGAQAASVTVTYTVVSTTSGREATLTGVYASTIQVPFAGAFPIARNETVKTFIPVI